MLDHLSVINFFIVLYDRKRNEILQCSCFQEGSVVEVVCCYLDSSWYKNLKYRSFEWFFSCTFHSDNGSFGANWNFQFVVDYDVGFFHLGDVFQEFLVVVVHFVICCHLIHVTVPFVAYLSLDVVGIRNRGVFHNFVTHQKHVSSFGERHSLRSKVDLLLVQPSVSDALLDSLQCCRANHIKTHGNLRVSRILYCFRS